MDERDAEIDAYLAAVEQDVSLVFGRFLSGIPDDPRDITWDILFLSLMDAGLDRVVSGMPWGSRARTAARLAPDVREDSTRGLDSARDELTRNLNEKLRATLGEAADTASRMRLEGKTSGFRDVLENDLGRALVTSVVDALSNTLLAWERTVLERIAPDDAVYQYAGPVDKRNREFCAAIAPQQVVRTRGAIEALNAHPLLHWYVPPNVFTYCGGVNCRHLWIPMSRTTAAARGLAIIEETGGEGDA